MTEYTCDSFRFFNLFPVYFGGKGTVVATHYIDGSVRPQKIVLATGPVYEIEDSREAAPGKAHTTGELARRYIVKIKGKETYLYETGGRWFVEMKA